jgi:rare lipoprotein A
MAFVNNWRAVILLGGALALLGCNGPKLPSFLQSDNERETTTGSTTRLVERDVEAPEVFQMSEAGLWDGRPSLGGVWVAHPDVRDPERVIIRNTSNGRFVIGALFRRERDNPGPRFQVSSDAADALGLLAGQPVEINVTALRREEVPDAPAEALAEPEDIAAAPLDPIAAAAAALDEAEGVAPATPAPAAAPVPAAQTTSTLAKPYIQIGIFSVEANASNTAQAMRGAGMIPVVKPGVSSGKQFWRVIVGPAATSAERAELLRKIRDLGFNDAYFVTN